MDGYGTDQSFLYYLDFKYAKELDYVFYVFCTNDLRNIYENNIFALDERGGLVRSQVPPSPWWVRSIRRFHTTYLVVDVLQRLRLTQKGLARRLDDEHHRQEYLSRGRRARFHDERAKVIFPAEMEIVDLYEEFVSGAGEDRHDDWHFEDDGHWNEAANHLAATYIYRFVENDLELPRISDQEIGKEIFTYYSSFNGWMPESQYLEETEIDGAKKRRIQAKYEDVEVDR